MKTTVGDIELELWAKETAKAYRNFIQLCMEGYWDDTIFHRIIKGFITQDGDPTGTGEGGRILYKFTILSTRFNCCDKYWKDDNGSQYFFILSSTPDLQNKHTVFGRVTGESIYSMLKLEEALVDENDKPLYPPRLIKSIILNNPFSDIIPRIIVQEKLSSDNIVLYNEKFCYRDINLLSFRAEAEEDEEESVILNKKFTAVEPRGLANKKRKGGLSSGDWENDDEIKTQEELEVSNEEKDIKCIERYKKGTKKVQNYKIDDVEDDKDIKENE
ncbi:Peptidyl-prolyl isomerase cwc27 [Eufriesea mexicana]|uniref:Peptidyl-prolyl cis-trans isomerase n=1 Tax=Eufriesea mexicana TaxID=516756 RepID=A0A310SLF3_9HYME|nr:Peptidyl-prolyl isomerase cwc27 [Eufriesea mexicana]